MRRHSSAIKASRGLSAPMLATHCGASTCGTPAFVVNGHTHRRLVRTFGEMTIINAGTLYRKHAPCFCIADFEQGFVQYFNVEGDGSFEAAEQFPLPPKSPIE